MKWVNEQYLNCYMYIATNQYETQKISFRKVAVSQGKLRSYATFLDINYDDTQRVQIKSQQQGRG